MTTIRFVATSVLSSDDGLSYKTEQLEDEDTHKKRLEKEKAGQGRTLWEQLEEQKEAKKAQQDAITKQIFAPPKALDEEEASYLEGVLEQERSRDRRRADEEERELAAFAVARANRELNHVPVSGGGGGGGGGGGSNNNNNNSSHREEGGTADRGTTVVETRKQDKEEKKKAFPAVKLNVKIKRKEKTAASSSSSKGKGKEKEKEKEGEEEEQEEGNHKKQKKEAEEEKKPAANPLAMLAAYGSDDDSD